jgi:predicted phosphodiesterase
MAKQTARGKLVQETILKFPNTSKHGIAELLFTNHPHLFDSKEHARYLVRNYTGSGSKNYATQADYKGNFTPQNQYGLNYSKCKKREFVNLPTSSNNILWLSDIHFPNHDIEALTAALDYGKKMKVNCIVLGGDILDNEPFTNHDAPPPSKDDVIEWFDMVEDFLDMLNNHFPKAHKVWLEGNHDNWYVRYLMKKAPVLFGDEYYRLPQRLNLKNKNVEFLEQHKILRAGKLQLLHGHTLVKGFIAPVNPARGVFLRTKSSTLIGHVHQNSYHPERNMKGEIIGCWSVGCLCTLSPDYDPHNTKHGNGFAHITTEKNGNFNVQLKEIFNGKIL